MKAKIVITAKATLSFSSMRHLARMREQDLRTLETTKRCFVLSSTPISFARSGGHMRRSNKPLLSSSPKDLHRTCAHDDCAGRET